MASAIAAKRRSFNTRSSSARLAQPLKESARPAATAALAARTNARSTVTVRRSFRRVILQLYQGIIAIQLRTTTQLSASLLLGLSALAALFLRAAVRRLRLARARVRAVGFGLVPCPPVAFLPPPLRRASPTHPRLLLSRP